MPVALRYFTMLLALTSCEPDITTRFATMQEARSKGAFERGWLPPILPESTRSIRETNNLDANIGEGGFEFDPSEYATFASLLTPASPKTARIPWRSRDMEGFAIFIYRNNGTLWTLALHPQGKGMYAVESRGAEKSAP